MTTKRKPKPSDTPIGTEPKSVVYPGKPSNWLNHLGRPTDLSGA